MPQLVFMNVGDFMNEAGFFRWLVDPCGFPPPFFVNEALSFLKCWGEGPASEAGRALGVGAGTHLKEFS